MPVQSQEQETLNVKRVHFPKQNSLMNLYNLRFSVTDEHGKEEIITGETRILLTFLSFVRTTVG